MGVNVGGIAVGETTTVDVGVGSMASSTVAGGSVWVGAGSTCAATVVAVEVGKGVGLGSTVGVRVTGMMVGSGGWAESGFNRPLHAVSKTMRAAKR